MPYKDKEDRNAWFRRKRIEDPKFKEKAYAATSKWEKEHKQERNKSRAKWMRDHRFKNYKDAREYEFDREMKKYSTTVEWYRDKLIEQKGLCAICRHLSRRYGNIQRLQVDHDHTCCDIKTKSCGECLRGLLCADCNILLSYLEKFLKDVYGMYEARYGTWTNKALKYLKH